MADDLAARLRSDQWQEVDAALAEAVENPTGDLILADFAVTTNGLERARAVALLGDLSGTDGATALRRLVHAVGPGSRDVRCASLLALAKRCGEEASADLTEALSDRDGTVKDYAVIGLAGAGDGRAWDLVFGRLKVLLRRPSRVLGKSETLMAVCYLVQHLNDDADRLPMLVETLRKKWDRMNEEEIAWFAEFWPDAFPDRPLSVGVSTPDRAMVRQWARDPLFQRVSGPPHEHQSSATDE